MEPITICLILVIGFVGSLSCIHYSIECCTSIKFIYNNLYIKSNNQL